MKAQLLYERLGNCMPGDSISISAATLKDILGEVRPDFEIIESEEEGEATYTLSDLVHCNCAACS